MTSIPRNSQDIPDFNKWESGATNAASSLQMKQNSFLLELAKWKIAGDVNEDRVGAGERIQTAWFHDSNPNYPVKLDLAGMNLKSLPPFLSRIKYLEELDLTGNALETDPDLKSLIPGLKTLRIEQKTPRDRALADHYEIPENRPQSCKFTSQPPSEDLAHRSLDPFYGYGPVNFKRAQAAPLPHSPELRKSIPKLCSLKPNPSSPSASGRVTPIENKNELTQGLPPPIQRTNPAAYQESHPDVVGTRKKSQGWRWKLPRLKIPIRSTFKELIQKLGYKKRDVDSEPTSALPKDLNPEPLGQDLASPNLESPKGASENLSSTFEDHSDRRSKELPRHLNEEITPAEQTSDIAPGNSNIYSPQFDIVFDVDSVSLKSQDGDPMGQCASALNTALAHKQEVLLLPSNQQPFSTPQMSTISRRTTGAECVPGSINPAFGVGGGIGRGRPIEKKPSWLTHDNLSLPSPVFNKQERRPLIPLRPLSKSQQLSQSDTKVPGLSEDGKQVLAFFMGQERLNSVSRWPSYSKVMEYDNGVKAFGFESSRKNLTPTLESDHSYIQWLFPTNEKSRFNTSAPTLKQSDFSALQNNASVMKRVDIAFEKMLGFYGLTWDDRLGVRELPETKLESCQRCWLTHRDHNSLRITRIIRSMHLFGKSEKAKSLLTYLERIAPGHESLPHWRNAIKTPALIFSNSPDLNVYQFASKQLPDDADFIDGFSHRNRSAISSDLKRNIFNKQKELYEEASPSVSGSPLRAIFSLNSLHNYYKEKQHLQKKLNTLKNISVDFTPKFYFADANKVGGIYDMHVDFANACLGGGWARGGDSAQEEVAFMENVGLGMVAHFARKYDGQSASPESKLKTYDHPTFRRAFLTRDPEDGTPNPIIIEGCERVAQFNSTAFNQKDGENSLSAAEKLDTNWLAIAASDLRVDSRTGKRTMEPISIEAFTDIFSTAHAGFLMAMEHVEKNKPKEKLKIHTGLLGAGVFKNNKVVSISAQMLAAKVVGVDNVKFYGCDDEEIFLNPQFQIESLNQIISDVVSRVSAANNQPTVEVLMKNVWKNPLFLAMVQDAGEKSEEENRLRRNRLN